MCGIAGFAGLRDPGLIRAMTAALERRGPDEEGFLEEDEASLGIRRLSIIDLETGSQPISGEEGRATVVLNGEIYNHKELRSELESRGHRFRSRSDTEAIVHLYEDLGPGCVDKLRGMFAFAVWDRRDRSLFIARDRVGIKPLYYAVLGGRLYFASEFRALLRVPEIPRELDAASVREFADLLYISSPHSLFKSVRKLEPGCWLRWRAGTVETRRYWTVPSADTPASEDEAAERLDGLLRAAVLEQREADVPVGLFLSGGLDSSLIGAYLAEAGSPPEAYCLNTGHPAFDETEKARSVARALGLAFHEVPVDPRLDLEAFLDAVDEPLADSSAIAAYRVSRACRAHMKVALTGVGGDELFGGYPRYAGLRLHGAYARLPRGLRSALARAGVLVPDTVGSRNLGSWIRRFLAGGALPAAEAYRSWIGHAEADLFAGPPGPGGAEAPPCRAPWGLRDARPGGADAGPGRPDAVLAAFAEFKGDDPVRAAMHADLRTYLPEGLLALTDRSSMAWGLELRVPLLDERVVEYMCGLPSGLKVRGRTMKVLQRRLLKGRLPPEILNQKKRGFMVPMSLWLRGELSEAVRDCLSPKTVRERGLFRPEAVARVLSEHMSGRRDRPDLLWALLLLELWQRRHMPRPALSAGAARMRLLVVSDFHFADSEGGAGRVAYESAKELARRGHEVACWGPSPEGLPERETRDGMTLWRAPVGLRPKGIANLAGFFSDCRGHLDKTARDFSPSVLLSHHPRAAWLSGRAPALAKVPRLHFFHSCWAEEYRLDGPAGPARAVGAGVRDWVERSVFSGADAFAVLSGYMASHLAGHGVDERKIRRVPPGVDLARFVPNGGGAREGGLELLTVRNLRPRMGLENLLEALALLKDTLDFRLTVAGIGPLRGFLEARAAALGIEGRVAFAGRVPDEDLPPLYRASDLFVLPSAGHEGLGLVLLEALASGLPAVGTPVGGIPEFLSRLDPAWVAAGTSPSEIAAAVSAGAARAREAPVRAACRSFAEGFPWENTAAGLEEALRGVLS